MHRLIGVLILSIVVLIAGCKYSPEGSTPTDPAHIYEEVKSDFVIDADIVSFPDVKSLAIYEATPRFLTEEQVTAFLSTNQDTAVEWFSHDPEYAVGYICTTSRGSRFWGGTSPTGLFPGDLTYSTSMDDRWDNCYLYSGQAHYNDNAEYVFADLFTEPKDFAFASAIDAEGHIRNALSLLGLNNLKLNRILYIDHDTIANKVTPILQTEEWQAADKTGAIPTYDDWSESDDGYIFEFCLSVDNIPLFSTYVDMSTLAYQGDTIRVWYQASGIIKLEAAASLWNIGKPVETYTTYISATEALATARNRLENTKTYANVTVYKVSAEYFYVMDGNRFLLQPVWVIYAKTTGPYGFSSTEHVVIDAITGEEIY